MSTHSWSTFKRLRVSPLACLIIAQEPSFENLIYCTYQLQTLLSYLHNQNMRSSKPVTYFETFAVSIPFYTHSWLFQLTNSDLPSQNIFQTSYFQQRLREAVAGVVTQARQSRTSSPTYSSKIIQASLYQKTLIPNQVFEIYYKICTQMFFIFTMIFFSRKFLQELL